jgi:hypothetical protein
MTDRHRKSVHVDLPIGAVLDAYLDGPDVPLQQSVCSAALFLYFMFGMDGRAAVDGFYEYWKRARPPRFSIDRAPPFPPSIVLDFPGDNTFRVFLGVLSDHLTKTIADADDPLFSKPAADSAASAPLPAPSPPASASGKLPQAQPPTRPAEKRVPGPASAPHAKRRQR